MNINVPNNNLTTTVPATSGYIKVAPKPSVCPTCGTCPTCGRQHAQSQNPFWTYSSSTGGLLGQAAQNR